MNTFANSLFTLLFSGFRSLIQGVWVSVTSGSLNGFFVWLGDHWAWVLLALCLLGTAADFIIWLIRWRPYLIWRTKARRFSAWLRNGKAGSQRQFRQGYQEGVSLEMPEEEAPAPGPAWIPEEYQAPPAEPWQQPPAPDLEEAPVSYEAPASYEEPASYEAPVSYEVPEPQAYAAPAPAEPMPEPAPQRRFFPAEVEYQAPPIYVPSYLDNEFSSDMPAARRRRRSEKYDRRRAAWHQRLISPPDEEEGMLDGLPPAIDREQAFHEPVYPAQSPYSPWQKPEEAKKADG